MSRLAAIGLMLGIVMGSELALISVYVPGQYRDGIYIRPHFLQAPEAILEHKSSIGTGKVRRGSGPAKPAVLDGQLPEKSSPAIRTREIVPPDASPAPSSLR